MNVPLFTTDVLRWKTSLPSVPRLNSPGGTAEKRSPICGSRITVDINLADGRVSEIGLLVQACSFGEASSSIFLSHAIGRTPQELSDIRDQLTEWLERDGPVPNWPNIEVLEPARRHSSKRPVIQLVFEAAAEAAAQASA